MVSRLTPQPAPPAPLLTFSWENQALRLNPQPGSPPPSPQLPLRRGPCLPSCLPAPLVSIWQDVLSHQGRYQGGDTHSTFS